jgi:acyl-CoA synthetase (AMP-forming)/AMP-acid ligase II
MTETASQVATARHGSPELILLDHVDGRSDEDGRLAFRTEALLTGVMTEEGFEDPVREGWYVTPDLGSVDGRMLRVAGRTGDFVKIGGESVDLSRLDRILAKIELNAAVLAARDERLGFVIHLAVAAEDPERVSSMFDARVLPFERARAVHRVAEIPRTPLGKVKRSELASMLGI